MCIEKWIFQFISKSTLIPILTAPFFFAFFKQKFTFCLFIYFFLNKIIVKMGVD